MKRIGMILALCAAALICGILWGGGHEAVPANAGEEVKLPILMYHSVLDSKAKAGKYVVTPAVLEADLQYLQQHGYTAVLPSQVIAYARGEGILPAKPVMLTFDDGCYNNLSYVYPLLERYDMCALFSVVGSFTQQYSEPGAVMNNNYSYLSWQQLRGLQATGRVEIGDHSYDLHRSETRQGCSRIHGESEEAFLAALRKDLGEMQRLLAGNLPGQKTEVLTYPYGRYDSAAERVAEELGFAMTLTCEERVSTIRQGQPEMLRLLGRFNRPYGETTWAFMERALP